MYVSFIKGELNKGTLITQLASVVSDVDIQQFHW